MNRETRDVTRYSFRITLFGIQIFYIEWETW